MENATYIIADKDSACRERLKTQLKNVLPHLRLIGEAGTGEAAYTLIRNLKPDIVLMDVDMPDIDGFAIVHGCREKFALVIITEGVQHAFKAIKANAADYLLKPAGDNELRAAFAKAIQFIQAGWTGTVYKDVVPLKETEIKLPVRAGNSYEMVSTEEIVLCKADNNYTEIRLRDKRKFLLSKTLKFYENRLKNQNFCRIHQSFLVNLNFVKSLEKGRYSHLILKDGTKLEIAQARKEQVFNVLGF